DSHARGHLGGRQEGLFREAGPSGDRCCACWSLNTETLGKRADGVPNLWEEVVGRPFAGRCPPPPPLFAATVASNSAGATAGCLPAAAVPTATAAPRHAHRPLLHGLYQAAGPDGQFRTVVSVMGGGAAYGGGGGACALAIPARTSAHRASRAAR